MPEDMQRIVDLVAELWNTGDSEIANQLYDDRSERRAPNGTARGAQGIANYVTEVHSAFPDFKLEITDTLSQGNQVAVHWRATGTQKGEFLGIPPTGQQVEVYGISLERIENGRVLEELVYFDQLSLMQQLGVAPGMQAEATSAAG
jgi:steroid delta-isomerase-like uncharacterized protein